MNRYTIYCTEEQTRKALELGATIKNLENIKGRYESTLDSFLIDNVVYIKPTAEQMRGWLMDKLKATTFANKHYSCCDKEGFGFLIISAECVLEIDASDNGRWLLSSDKEATLAAIDAALEYLSNK